MYNDVKTPRYTLLQMSESSNIIMVPMLKGGCTMDAQERDALKAELTELFAQLSEDERATLVKTLLGEKQG